MDEMNESRSNLKGKEERVAESAASSNGDVDSSFQLQSSLSDGTTPSKKETNEAKISFTRKFVELPGPGGITYYKVCKQIRVAKSNQEKFGSMDPKDLGAISQSLLERAKETLEDVELNSFVKR